VQPGRIAVKQTSTEFSPIPKADDEDRFMKARIWLTFVWAVGISLCSETHGEDAVSTRHERDAYSFTKYEHSPFFDKGWWGVMKDFWPQAVEGLRAENAAYKPGGIVFIGDSITAAFESDEFFPKGKVIKQGVSGDRVIGVINRLDVSVDALKPSKVLLLIGTNDTNNPKMTREEFEKEYDFLLEELGQRLPKKAIYIQTIMPRRGSYGSTNDKVREYNQVIRALGRKHKVHLIDTYPAFLDDKNELKDEYTEDGVHLNRQGQEVWATLLAPAVNRR